MNYKFRGPFSEHLYLTFQIQTHFFETLSLNLTTYYLGFPPTSLAPLFQYLLFFPLLIKVRIPLSYTLGHIPLYFFP